MSSSGDAPSPLCVSVLIRRRTGAPGTTENKGLAGRLGPARVLLVTTHTKPTCNDPTRRRCRRSKVGDMGPSSFSWTVAAPRSPTVGPRERVRGRRGAPPVPAALPPVGPRRRLPRCGRVEAVRIASDQGARVTALCPEEQATEARAAGAEVILDPARIDPTCYRGAWSVIVDPVGGIGLPPGDGVARARWRLRHPFGPAVGPRPRPARAPQRGSPPPELAGLTRPSGGFSSATITSWPRVAAARSSG